MWEKDSNLQVNTDEVVAFVPGIMTIRINKICLLNWKRLAHKNQDFKNMELMQCEIF